MRQVVFLLFFSIFVLAFYVVSISSYSSFYTETDVNGTLVLVVENTISYQQLNDPAQKIYSQISYTVGDIANDINLLLYQININIPVNDVQTLIYQITYSVQDIAQQITTVIYKIKYYTCESMNNICYLFKTYEPPPPPSNNNGGNSSSGDGGWGSNGGSGEVPSVAWNSILDVAYIVVLLAISMLPIMLFGRKGIGGAIVLLALYSEAGLIPTWIIALAVILVLGLIFIEVRGGGEGGG